MEFNIVPIEESAEISVVNRLFAFFKDGLRFVARLAGRDIALYVEEPVYEETEIFDKKTGKKSLVKLVKKVVGFREVPKLLKLGEPELRRGNPEEKEDKDLAVVSREILLGEIGELTEAAKRAAPEIIYSRVFDGELPSSVRVVRRAGEGGRIWVEVGEFPNRDRQVLLVRQFSRPMGWLGGLSVQKRDLGKVHMSELDKAAKERAAAAAALQAARLAAQQEKAAALQAARRKKANRAAE